MADKKPEPKAKPTSGGQGFAGEKKLKLRAKGYLTVDGIIYEAGDEFELAEREALNLVGMGSAEELPGEAPAPPKE